MWTLIRMHLDRIKAGERDTPSLRHRHTQSASSSEEAPPHSDDSNVRIGFDSPTHSRQSSRQDHQDEAEELVPSYNPYSDAMEECVYWCPPVFLIYACTHSLPLFFRALLFVDELH